MRIKKIIGLLAIIIVSALITACQSSNSDNKPVNQSGSGNLEMKDSSATTPDKTTIPEESDKKIIATKENQLSELPVVLIYNFHITNRCVSCIAIEEATTKTLNTYFPAELKNGRIERQVLNVDKKENNAISEKYQVFGSGLFITRVFKGKESTTDLTGEGFKFAKNKQDKFIEILRTKISEYLK